MVCRLVGIAGLVPCFLLRGSSLRVHPHSNRVSLACLTRIKRVFTIQTPLVLLFTAEIVFCTQVEAQSNFLTQVLRNYQFLGGMGWDLVGIFLGFVLLRTTPRPPGESQVYCVAHSSALYLRVALESLSGDARIPVLA